MATLDSTTRPANTGGIDISHLDPAWAVFEGTGGGAGAPQQSPLQGGDAPLKTGDWVTNWGKGDLAHEIDFTAKPADPDAPYKLLAEPEFSHPLLDLLGGQDGAAPVLPDGGPEGAAHPAVIVGAVLIVGAMIAAAGHLSGAFDKKEEKYVYTPKFADNPKGGLKTMVNDYRDPDADPAPLDSPAEMFGHLIASPGMPVVEAGKIAIGDPLADLSDRLAKVIDLIGAAAPAWTEAGASGSRSALGGGEDGGLAGSGRGQAGTLQAATDAVADLMGRLGLDADAFDFRALTAPSHDIGVGVFEAFGIAGGLDGMAILAKMHESGGEAAEIAGHIAELSAWLDAWIDVPA